MKLNLEKTYDIMEWSFIVETLCDAGIPENLTQTIMRCIKRRSCRLLWNGEVTDQIKPSRGPRQGDLLSSYLFILCLERLAHWIQAKEDARFWKPVKASRRGPSISHLFFADDILLFSEVDEDQVEPIQEGISRFAQASCQKINFNKSNVYFSPSVPKQDAKSLSHKLGMPPTKNMKKYLGFKLRHHGNNRNSHSELPQKVRSKLIGWGSKCLSRAGRITLVRLVLNAMPMFQMQRQCSKCN